MVFKKWLNEAIVKFADISNSIKQTLQYIISDGVWKFEQKTHGLSSAKTVSVAGHFYNEKGHFFISIHVMANKPIDSYDSQTGQIDENSKVQIIASVSYIPEKRGGYRLYKIAERSNSTEDGRLHTPYEAAKWIKIVIDEYQPPNDGDAEDPIYDPSPEPANSNNLVGV